MDDQAVDAIRRAFEEFGPPYNSTTILQRAIARLEIATNTPERVIAAVEAMVESGELIAPSRPSLPWKLL